MPIDFPSNPTNGQVFSNWIYDSSITAWRNVNTDTGIGTLNAMGLKNVVPSSVVVGSGSATVNSNGMVTFSAATSISLNGCFTSTYSNYRILAYELGSNTANTATKFRLRQSGSDSTGLYYQNGPTQSGANATGAYYLSNATWWDMYPPPASPNYGSFTIDLFQPQLALRTSGNFMALGYNSSVGMASGGLLHDTASIYDGFSLITNSSATFTGKIQVFGYTN